jgi:hypothetical protein
MNISIKHLGRIGNCIIRLKNVIHIALYYNYNIILPKHRFLNTRYLVINKNITLKAENLRDSKNFFYRDKIKNIDKSLFDINKDNVISILKDICIFKNIFKDITPLGKNDLTIHIRSGDLFTKEYPHALYVSPPLSYYTNIIGQNNYEKIYLIAEDTINPCINKLLELYPNIIFRLQSLEEDIKIVLSTTNMVVSFGTFIPELLYLSDNIKNVYLPSYFPVETKPGCNIHLSNLSKYYKCMFPWKNTTEQRKILLEYGIEVANTRLNDNEECIKRI